MSRVNWLDSWCSWQSCLWHHFAEPTKGIANFLLSFECFLCCYYRSVDGFYFIRLFWHFSVSSFQIRAGIWDSTRSQSMSTETFACDKSRSKPTHENTSFSCVQWLKRKRSERHRTKSLFSFFSFFFWFHQFNCLSIDIPSNAIWQASFQLEINNGEENLGRA